MVPHLQKPPLHSQRQEKDRAGAESLPGEHGPAPKPTVLGQLRGADKGGNLEGVLADGAAAQTLHAPPRHRVALLLQLRFRGGQTQVRGRVFQLLGFGLRVDIRHRQQPTVLLLALVIPHPFSHPAICCLSFAKLFILMISLIPAD